jgi:5'-deoxynucleotidase YfbR-like HD superfamily hydrolase
MTPYLATMTRRWHTNPHLGHTGDTLASHGGRMAVLALMLWPEPDANLLAQCVTHDLGEYKTGDTPWNAPKNRQGEFDALKAMGMYYVKLDPRLKLLDMLDAYLWARHHAPHLMGHKDWQGQREKMLALAFDIGVSLDVFNLGGDDAANNGL